MAARLTRTPGAGSPFRGMHGARAAPYDHEMRTKLGLSLVAVGILAFACTSEERNEDPNKDNQALKVVFLPTCGSPGDRIQIQVNSDTCRRRDPANPDSRPAEVTFRPGHAVTRGISSDYVASEPFSPAEVSGESRNYTLDLVVPEGAETGTVDIVGCGNLLDDLVVSSSVFTIPCPPGGQDGGGPDGGPGADGGPTEKAPLSGMLNILRTGGASYFDAIFYGTLPRTQQADAENELAFSLLRIAPPIPLGTCAAPASIPPLPAEPTPGVSAGDLTLAITGSPAQPYSPQVNGTSTSYQGPFVSAAENTPVDLTLAGAPAFPGATIAGALRTAPALAGLAPDLTGQVDVPAADFTFTFTPTPATNMTLALTPIGGGGGTVYCAIDPGAGTFKIPAATLGASGSTFAASLRLGNVIEKTDQNRRFVSIGETSRSFTLKVQ